MFCLSCGKKISPRSLFCKYCGVNQKKVNIENNSNTKKYVWTCFYCDKEYETKLEADKHETICIDNPKNKKFYYNSNPKKAWFILWITTMLVFGITLFLSVRYAEKQITLLSGDILLSIFLANILIGVFAFLAMAISGTKSGQKTSGFIKNILLICLIYLIINPAIFATEGFRASHNSEYAKQYSNNLIPSVTPTSSFSLSSSPTNTPFPTKKIVPKTNTNTSLGTNSGSVECIGPDGKHFNTTMSECKSLNEKWGKSVDYMTNCNYPTECGGGVKREAYSECMKPCTRISTGSNNTQINNQNNSNKIAVFLSYGGYTVYCPSQNASAVQSINSTMESKKTQWAKDYNSCADTLFKNDPCYVTCSNTNKAELADCYSKFGYSGTQSESCTKPSWDKYSVCISTCPTASKSCDWVYSEQKSLLLQIEILCK